MKGERSGSNCPSYYEWVTVREPGDRAPYREQTECLLNYKETQILLSDDRDTLVCPLEQPEC